MPLSSTASFRYAIDVPRRLALARMAGVLTGRDMQLVAEAVHGDPDWEPGFDAIWDCSAVRAHAVLPDEVDPIIEALDTDLMGRDVLIEGPDLAADLFAKLLILRARRRGAAAYACRTIDEALAVLGLDALPASLQTVEATAP